MEWVEALKTAIDYIERHLLEKISVEEVARQVYLSPFYFQKGFKLITGYTVGEYIRNRRLYLAALEVVTCKEVKVIQLAYKYGYDTPESFTKAFTRFHGMSPMQLKGQGYELVPFQPLQLELSIKGGNKIDAYIEKMSSFKVIGIEYSYQYETAFNEIPKFWEEYKTKTVDILKKNMQNIGCFGISIDENTQNKTCKYLIAGPYKENEMDVPKGFQIVTIPAFTWAKFRSVGPIPQAIQSLYLRIFKEWLPGNTAYRIAAGYNIEKYSLSDMTAFDYVSEIWIPVQER